MTLRDIVLHPISVFSAAFAVVGGWLQLPLLGAAWSVAWANAGALFAAVSVTATQLAPSIPWLPVAELQLLALLTGVLFVATRVDRLAESARERLDGDDP